MLKYLELPDHAKVEINIKSTFCQSNQLISIGKLLHLRDMIVDMIRRFCLRDPERRQEQDGTLFCVRTFSNHAYFDMSRNCVSRDGS